MTYTASPPLTPQQHELMRFQRGDPGAYENIPAGMYHHLDAASASRLNLLHRSPAHCRHAIDHPEDFETDAKAIGTAGHACLLEPETFNARYVLGPEVDLRTKAGRMMWEDFCATNEGKEVLRGKDGERLIGMHRSVWAHPAASRYLAKPGRTELSVVWNEASYLRKARLDRFCDQGAIFDLKCVRDASPDGFARAVVQYGYHRAAAFYLRGAQAVSLGALAFLFIAVENEPPHAVGVYALDDTAIQQGDRELVRLLRQWDRCCDTGIWPGYSGEVQYLTLPKWARDQESGF